MIIPKSDLKSKSNLKNLWLHGKVFRVKHKRKLVCLMMILSDVTQSV